MPVHSIWKRIVSTSTVQSSTASYMARLKTAYDNIKIIYYKPKEWTHAFRIEVPPAIAHDPKRLSETLEVVRRQTVNPAIMEALPALRRRPVREESAKRCERYPRVG